MPWYEAIVSERHALKIRFFIEGDEDAAWGEEDWQGEETIDDDIVGYDVCEIELSIDQEGEPNAS